MHPFGPFPFRAFPPPLPPPKKNNFFSDAPEVVAEPCNADARESGGHYALLMFVAAFGYVIADVAADGWMVPVPM